MNNLNLCDSKEKYFFFYFYFFLLLVEGSRKSKSSQKAIFLASTNAASSCKILINPRLKTLNLTLILLKFYQFWAWFKPLLGTLAQFALCCIQTSCRAMGWLRPNLLAKQLNGHSHGLCLLTGPVQPNILFNRNEPYIFLFKCLWLQFHVHVLNPSLKGGILCGLEAAGTKNQSMVWAALRNQSVMHLFKENFQKIPNS